MLGHNYKDKTYAWGHIWAVIYGCTYMGGHKR